MHSREKIEAAYLEIITSVKKLALKAIGKRHGIGLSTMYVFRKKFQGLAEVVSGKVVGEDDEEEEEDSTSGRAKKEKAEESNASSPETPVKEVQHRQKAGCLSLPAVAKIVGKSKRDVRRIIRDNKIEPDAVLIERRNGDVLGYSEDSIKKIRGRELKDVDSVELRTILKLPTHAYQRFLEYVALLMNDKMLAARLAGINHVFQQHKKRCSYKFPRSSIPDFKYLKDEFIKYDGRERKNQKKQRQLRLLKNKTMPTGEVSGARRGKALH